MFLKTLLIAGGLIAITIGGLSVWAGVYKHLHPAWNPFL
jgi:hypothetical protein